VHGELAAPLLGSHQLQVGDVGARHQEHEPDGREQRQQGLAHCPGDRVVERADVRDQTAHLAGSGFLVLVLQQRLKRRGRFSNRRARPQPRHQIDLAAGRVAKGTIDRHSVRGPPQLDAGGVIEIVRHHADDREALLAEADAPAEDRG
jgi:hypothetical protein